MEAEQKFKKVLNLTVFVSINAAVKGKLPKMPRTQGGRRNPRASSAVQDCARFGHVVTPKWGWR